MWLGVGVGVGVRVGVDDGDAEAVALGEGVGVGETASSADEVGVPGDAPTGLHGEDGTCFNRGMAVVSPVPVPGPVPGESVLTESDASLLFGGARTAYTFTDEPVTDAQLQAIHELAKWAPTAVNAQPLRVVAVRSPAARERLLPCLPRGNREQAAGAPLTLICAADQSFAESLPRLHPRAERYQRLLDEGGSDMRARWARASALIQAAYVIQAIRAVGLAAGPMNGDDAEALAAEFFAGQDVEVLLVINAGHPGPDAYQERNPRLSFDEVYQVL